MRTIGMVPVVKRTRQVKVAHCTACGRWLAEGVAVVNGRFIRNALVCTGCDRLGVRCTCE